MELYEKFKQGIELHTYQRVDSEYKVNTFLGYNDDGRMSMVMTENGDIAKVKSSKQIDVQMKKREDGKIALSFDLLDNTYSSLFVVFCKDMIVYCERVGKDQAIANALIRWRYWVELFGKKPSILLEKSEVKGLLGELLVMRDLVIPKYGIHNALYGWMGPLSGHKDFEISDTWYEVKSVNESAVQVMISSLEQLESEVDGHLVIARVEDSSESSIHSITLNKLITEITDMINDPDDLDVFRSRLTSAGYCFDNEYEDMHFTYKGMTSYSVPDTFPKINRKDIPVAIGNVKYTILIDGIETFKED